MGNKPSNIFQMDRPESGGADHDEARENSGLLERDKQEFAQSEKRRHAAQPPKPGDERDDQRPKAEPEDG